MVNTFIKIGAVLVFISVGLWFFAFSPFFSDINTLKRSLEDKVKVYEETKKRVDNLERLQEKYSKLDEEVKKVNEMLPSKPEFPKLLVETEALVRKSGVALTSVSFSSPKVKTQAQGVKKYSIRLSFSAGYETFKNFLRLQEKEMRLMDVDSISFSPSEGGVYEFQVNLTTYYQ